MAATSQSRRLASGGSRCAGGWLATLFAALFAVTAGAQNVDVPFIMLDGQRVHPTSILVRYAPRVTAAHAGAAMAAASLRTVHEFHPSSRWALLDLKPDALRPAAGQEGQALKDRIQKLMASGLYEAVEPDHIGQISLVPSDGFYLDGTLWGLRNVGQQGGVSGADIDAARAWDITTGSTNVIVGVIDSGVRYTHLDLAAQMWRNPTPTAGALFGTNAIAGTGDPNDDNGHGTHVAGTIAAAANNGQPHIGVAWNVRVMALKAADSQGRLPDSAIAACIDFAIAKGVKVLNCSFGSRSFSLVLSDAFQRAQAAGILVICAAGNSGRDVGQFPEFPAAFAEPIFGGLDNIISVAAMDRFDALAPFSNFGSNGVHLGAPGVQIMSTFNTADNSYQLLDGTSMAAPHVTGVAALIYSLTNTMTYTEARSRILLTTTPVAALATNTVSGGRLNAYRALTTGADGILEIAIKPSSGSTLLAGTTVPITVFVNDLLPVNNATVVGTVPGVFTNQVFLNTGVSPDTVAGDNQHAFNLNVPAVTTNLTLTLVVTAPGKTGSTNTFTYRTEPIPPNDNFSSPAKVPDPGGVVFGDNTFGSLEFGEPAHAGVSNVANSVWWNWAPTNSGAVLVDTAGSSFDTIVAVYTGNILTNLTLIAATNDVGAIPQGFVGFTATAGTTYRIAVASASTNAVGQIRLRVQFNGVADTTAPNVAITNIVSGPNSVTNPPSGLIVTNATLTLSGTAADPGTNAIGVSQVFVRLNSGLSVTASGTNNWSIPLFLVSGTNDIQVSAADFSGNTSVPISFQVNYRVFDPFNDVLANALELPGTAGATTTNNANATLEPGEPLHAGKQGGKSVWYYFTPPSDGVLSITTSNSTFDTLLAIYTGTRVDRLTAVSGNDDTPTGFGVYSEIAQAVRAGTRYYIAVDGLSGASGQIFLGYSFTAVPIFDLTVTATTGGVAFPVSGSFTSNTVVDVTAVASNGFSFVTWTGDALSLDNPLRVTLARPTALNAVFAPTLLADNFESGAFRANIGWATNNAAGIAPWFVEAAAGQATNAPAGGGYHARSGVIGNGQTTILRLVANCRAGSAAFAYRVSAEEFGPTQGDFFEFYLNGVLQLRLNGESGWQVQTFNVPAGTNTLEWRYIKDPSSSGGLDAVFLDNLDLPLVEPVNLAVPVVFNTSSLRQVSGGLQFRIEGQTNQVYFVQASSDLANWVTVSTNYAPYGLIQFSEPQSLTNASRYYRVRLP